MNKAILISNQLPNDKMDARVGAPRKPACYFHQTRDECDKGCRAARQSFRHNGSIDRTQLIAAAAQALRPNHSVWRGHWELSELIQMLIGPKADWSVAFLLLSTSHTLQLTGMSRIHLSIPSIRYLGAECMNVPLDFALQLPSVLMGDMHTHATKRWSCCQTFP